MISRKKVLERITSAREKVVEKAAETWQGPRGEQVRLLGGAALRTAQTAAHEVHDLVRQNIREHSTVNRQAPEAANSTEFLPAAVEEPTDMIHPDVLENTYYSEAEATSVIKDEIDGIYDDESSASTVSVFDNHAAREAAQYFDTPPEDRPRLFPEPEKNPFKRGVTWLRGRYGYRKDVDAGWRSFLGRPVKAVRDELTEIRRINHNRKIDKEQRQNEVDRERNLVARMTAATGRFVQEEIREPHGIRTTGVPKIGLREHVREITDDAVHEYRRKRAKPERAYYEDRLKELKFTPDQEEYWRFLRWRNEDDPTRGSLSVISTETRALFLDPEPKRRAFRRTLGVVAVTALAAGLASNGYGGDQEHVQVGGADTAVASSIADERESEVRTDHRPEVQTLDLGAMPAVAKHVTTVEPGDSIWRISDDVLQSYDYDAGVGTVNDVMTYVLEVNDLTPDSMIHPGDELYVPTEAELQTIVEQQR